MKSTFQIYNSLAREKQVFVSMAPGQVRMYVCGMTVYDFCHLGHARVMVVFDLLKRWLRALGYTVTYVRNITDIDDKIIRRALENGESIRELTDRFIAAMHEDADALGVERPDHEPRATEYVAEMQSMIQSLMDKRLAYRDESGDVNFSVRAFPQYGRLSGKSVDELRAGERVGVSGTKNDPLDFVLWKSAKADEPADAKWASAFGEGRPGWHIECSAMSCKLLGNDFDIHGGGADLQFPHHENEIAQSVGANGGEFARHWMHNGFVRVVTDGKDEKMSKSLGNFFTIRDILRVYDPEVIRFFILRAQYRSPLTYSEAHLQDAKAALGRLYKAVGDVQPVADIDWNLDFETRFALAMNDDLNTPVAAAVLFDMANEVNREADLALAARLKALAQLLGLLGRTGEAFLKASVGEQAVLGEADIEALIAQRAQAKAEKNFAKADDIRKSLLDQGVALEDVRGGPTQWRRV
ncbi:cysteine--tRNA ligase [Limnobacter humi]|uniref:Cysteine--tRNA ligase n=1 Tax=Limnobacter humi TaxID=1778671 RepID=A0ABT1WJG3_9BURK|nr:cysteine--tRNA ligase [Limnobacter humi]MCQ8897186.1 cysteine--tRNA ligase [Limnobacter humi]